MEQRVEPVADESIELNLMRRRNELLMINQLTNLQEQTGLLSRQVSDLNGRLQRQEEECSKISTRLAVLDTERNIVLKVHGWIAQHIWKIVVVIGGGAITALHEEIIDFIDRVMGLFRK